MPYRFAGDQLTALRGAMKQRDVASPAFELGDDGAFRLTEDANRVLGRIKQISGKEVTIEPANSVQALDGEPMWGSGSGYVDHDVRGKRIGSIGVVDPLMGTTHVVAHEGAHAAFPGELHRALIEGNAVTSINEDPRRVDRDSGARLRYLHEAIAKPALAEEAHAQGAADALLQSLGLPGEVGQSSPLNYPEAYKWKAVDQYTRVEPGPPSPYEVRELERIDRNTRPFLEREYRKGYVAASGL